MFSFFLRSLQLASSVANALIVSKQIEASSPDAIAAANSLSTAQLVGIIVASVILGIALIGGIGLVPSAFFGWFLIVLFYMFCVVVPIVYCLFVSLFVCIVLFIYFICVY